MSSAAMNICIQGFEWQGFGFEPVSTFLQSLPSAFTGSARTSAVLQKLPVWLGAF
jgi:hypothetical protein